MNSYKPPFHITDKMINLISEISEQVGRISLQKDQHINPHLRRENRIRTIHSSLAIEHNTLTLEQVTAIIDGKRVLGNPNEVREVQNAYEAYEMMLQFDPASIEDLLTAHRVMMRGLMKENGCFRSGGVGVFDGDVLIHMAPPAEFVPEQIRQLFEWYQRSSMHPLISLLLGQWKEVFFWVPIEELIKSRQQEYYDSLAQADKDADSAVFAELMLEIIRDTLSEVEVIHEQTDQDSDQGSDQDNDFVLELLKVLGNQTLSAAELMKRLGLSHRPTFRKNYLKPALEAGLIERTIPDKPSSRNQKYRKVRKQTI